MPEASAQPTRGDEGLPADGFVFCCFNNAYKITPEVFELWCRLLSDLPQAVLWLIAGDDARTNLRREAAARGIDAERLIFAEQRPQSEHLRRIPLADLFLDTWPYNAHTTAADALRMGLPVLSCPGRTLPSRVAASLLTAAGLTELISRDLNDYLGIARRLATNPEVLADLRRRLLAAHASAPVFDPTHFTRGLDALYLRMWQRHRDGRVPAPICAGTKIS